MIMYLSCLKFSAIGHGSDNGCGKRGPPFSLMSLEQIFASTTLDVVVPNTSVDFPSEESVDDWLIRLRVGSVDRKQTFFGVS